MTDLESAQEDQTPIPFLLPLPQTTCTRKHMHAHMHICTDVEPPSAPAAPRLASPCLPPSLPPSFDLLFCLCSHSDPQLQPQPSPPTSRDCCILSPPEFSEGFPCAAWRACRFQWSCRRGRSLGRVRLGPELSADSSSILQDPQLRGRLLPSSHASSSFFTGISCWTHT